MSRHVLISYLNMYDDSHLNMYIPFFLKMVQHSNNTVPKHERGSYFLIIEVHADKSPSEVNQRPSDPSLANKK